MSEVTEIRKSTPMATLLERPLALALRLDWEKILYGAIILLSLITRLAGVGDRVVSHDESLHTQYSFQYYNGDGYQHTALMHGPTLFHITALSYWLFGVSDTAARIPVALVGTILVILPYFLRDWIGRYGALFASVLLLISPYISYYSRYIRHDIYVITAATVTFIAILHYLRERKEKYLWWFAIGMALMFTTMETSYIYVAIFGSYLILALLLRTVTSDWFSSQFQQVRQPLAIITLALLMIGGGFLGQRLEGGVVDGPEGTPATVTEEGFAADPDETLDGAAGDEQASPLETAMRWLVVSGLFVLGGGLLLFAFRMRPHLDRLPEFDLVVLTATLTLPTASAFLVTLVGADPLAYSNSACQVAGQETMSAFRLFFARMSDAACRADFLASDALITATFLVITLVISVLVGLWWHRRRFLISAAIFHGIFLLLFTSLFSNPGGWTSGMVGSLGYWLEQQEVQRANQPTYFYLLVLPLYEFLPLLLTLAAAHLWARSARLSKVVGYWLLVTVSTLLAYSFSNWLVNRTIEDPNDHTRETGLIVGGAVLLLSLVYWFLVRRRQIRNQYNLTRGWRDLTSVDALIGITPYLLWWYIVTWIIYSLAGEKMAWLSSHFIMPMVLLAGWYVNRKIISANPAELFSRKFVKLTILAAAGLVALFAGLLPIILGQVTLGGQQLSNLNMLGRVLGALLVAAGVYYWSRRASENFEPRTKRRAWLFAGIGLLALLTVRFSYKANFVNADYVTEYMVYAHGAPATKSQVLSQLEELSMRLHGDKSIRVAYDNDSSWPMTWYLRDYPSRIYFGENPGRNITDAPVVIAGSHNWAKVEPLLGNDYDANTYTFLWWPMEEYRNISWNAVMGDPLVDPAERRGLANPGVRQALWDIFFYRDYEKYGEVFGGNYSIGQWPVRHELRMYIRKDTLATIWDHGVRAATIEPPVDPYAANALERLPESVLDAGPEGGTGLQQPRNVTIADDGTIFVADSGNHRIVVYDSGGQFITAWGAFGSEAGLFNEPWGVAVDGDNVYVADTWNHRVQHFTRDGELVGILGGNGGPTADDPGYGLFFGPRDIVILPNGNLLISDTGNHRLQELEPSGEFVRATGNQGSLPGQFYEPVGLALAVDGSIFVADTWNGRVQQLSSDYVPLGEWPVDAWSGESINNKPYLALDGQGRVLVTDPEAYRVLAFDARGTYLGRFGSFSNGLDGFGLPNGIAVDREGQIYVADAANNRVMVYAPLPELAPPLLQEQSDG